MAEQKLVLMLQEVLDPEDREQPIDYRDVTAPYSTALQIPKLLERVIPQVVDRIQGTTFHRAPERDTILHHLDLGDVAAENEITGLESYFVRTGQYIQASQGHARLVVGRKGSGKTAIFYEIRTSLIGVHSRLVLDLKPEGHQFIRLREFVLDTMTPGLQEHTLVAFWDFILLAELAHKILRQEGAYSERDPLRRERFLAVEAAYSEHQPDFDADFSQRLLKAVDAIVARLDGVPAAEIGARLTEIMFKSDIRVLAEAVGQYLRDKEEVWLLIDNLDKGWPTHGSSPEDILVLRSLLDATRKIQHSLGDRGVELKCLVFLRTDIYEHLLRETPDKGKDTAIVLDWSDSAVFEEIVLRRVLASTSVSGSFGQVWAMLFESHVEVQDTFDYLVERTQMRPRDLLLFIRKCVDVAVNRGHSRVGVEDILQAEQSYSDDLLLVTDFEISDTQPEFAALLYSFQGAPAHASLAEVKERLDHADREPGWADSAVEALLRFGFLGVSGPDFEQPLYSYATGLNIRRLTLAAEQPNSRLVIHPAFRQALDVSSS